MKFSYKCKLLCLILLLLFSILLLFGGVAVWFILPIVVRNKVSDILPLRQNTLIYQQWQNTTLPAYMQFWFFNIANPSEVEQGEQPYLVQRGPYTYREHRIKDNVTFDRCGSVSYQQRRIFKFERDKSIGDEEDIIITLNLPILVISDMLKGLPPVLASLVLNILKSLDYEKLDIFMQTSIKNITWGYVDPILYKFEWAIKAFNLPFSSTVGLFYGKNNSYDTSYLVDSGRNGVDNFLRIYKWNNSERLSMWYTPYANMVNGTDGTMFAPFLNESSRLYTFQSDICRSIYADFTRRTTVNGIPAFEFVAPYSVFANHSVNPDNIGFCLDGDCLGSGVLNMSKCIPGVPAVMSSPHFYQADESYINKVKGLKPGPEFATSLQLEPTTGLPLYIQKKLQINFAIEPFEAFDKMKNVQKMFLPVVWLNESVKIDDDLGGSLKSMLIIPVAVGYWGSIGAMALGAFGTILCLVFLVVIKVSHKDIYKSINNFDNA